jgi:hypothetical protein
MSDLLSRSRDWLRRNRGHGPIAQIPEKVSDVFPDGLPPGNMVHVLVVTEERTFIFVDAIVTCLTCALVLEGLEDVGGINVALKRTPVRCVSTAVLLLNTFRQDAKMASYHSGSHSFHHRPVLVPSQVWIVSSTAPKITFMPGDLQQISALRFPVQSCFGHVRLSSAPPRLCSRSSSVPHSTDTFVHARCCK